MKSKGLQGDTMEVVHILTRLVEVVFLAGTFRSAIAVSLRSIQDKRELPGD
jgi:hypothetical protein